MIDYHLHVIAHGDRPMTVDNILAYLEVAKSRGLRQMGITEHDRYLDDIDLAAFQEAREKYQDVELRLGIEIDFVPGAEERMDHDSSALPYDYVIGSVHRVDKVVVVTLTKEISRSGRHTNSTRRTTRTAVRRPSPALRDLGHPDLKIFAIRTGHNPDARATADAVAESGMSWT